MWHTDKSWFLCYLLHLLDHTFFITHLSLVKRTINWQISVSLFWIINFFISYFIIYTKKNWDQWGSIYLQSDFNCWILYSKSYFLSFSFFIYCLTLRYIFHLSTYCRSLSNIFIICNLSPIYIFFSNYLVSRRSAILWHNNHDNWFIRTDKYLFLLFLYLSFCLIIISRWICIINLFIMVNI